MVAFPDLQIVAGVAAADIEGEITVITVESIAEHSDTLLLVLI